MRNLDIPQTASTPLISCDPTVRILRITGESYPENAFEFYAPSISWVKECLAEQGELHVDINVSYLNSSSTKCMLDLLDLLEEAHVAGARVAVAWRYDRENPRSFDLAKEFQEDITLPFSIIAFDE
ncbi:MAG: DUF1987 domain-containing protein [Deltaproteobacteria bacterium]|nr:DUF1987 domain-containing protein [Deltaproteobacteria bacterium]